MHLSGTIYSSAFIRILCSSENLWQHGSVYGTEKINCIVCVPNPQEVCQALKFAVVAKLCNYNIT